MFRVFEGRPTGGFLTGVGGFLMLLALPLSTICYFLLLPSFFSNTFALGWSKSSLDVPPPVIEGVTVLWVSLMARRSGVLID